MNLDIQACGLGFVFALLTIGFVTFFAKVIDDVYYDFVEFTIVLIIEQHKIFILLLLLAELLKLLIFIFHCLTLDIFQ